MADTVNPADTALSNTSPRLVTVNLGSNLGFTGNVTGSIGGVSAGDVARKIYIQGSKVFSETWDGDAATRYTVQEGSAAEVNTISAAAQIGNRFLRVGNNTTPDQTMVVFNELIPFDATRLYRIQVIARRSSAGTNIPLYAGYIGMAADGVTPVDINGGTNSYGNAHNHAVAGTILQGPSAWTTFEGFTKGTASPGNFGVGTRIAPSKVHPNVKFLRPYVLCNFAVAGTTDINAILIDDITDVAILETKTDQIGSSYVVKLTTEGLVGGFGLYNTGSTVTAGFDVDEFYIGKTVGNRIKPFVLSNGVVYINSAVIADASIGSAKIADTIQSTTFNATQGWQINKDGTATFNQLTIRTSNGNIGGITIGSGFIRAGQTALNTGTGFYLGSNGTFSVGVAAGNRMVFDGTTLTVNGNITSTSGTIGGITIGSGFIRAGQTALNTGTGFYLGSNGTFSVGNPTGNRMVFDGTTLTIRGSLNASDINAGTLSASYISGGAIQTGSYIQSTTYTAGSGTSGWRINADGSAEFRNVTVRGSLNASDINAGTLSASYISAGAIQTGSYIQSTTYTAGSTGWRINANGSAEFNNNVTIRGTVTSSNITGSTVNLGNFTGYAWPAGTGTGAHLSGGGLLIGNANTASCLEFNTGTGAFFVGNAPSGRYLYFNNGSGTVQNLKILNRPVIQVGTADPGEVIVSGYMSPVGTAWRGQITMNVPTNEYNAYTGYDTSLGQVYGVSAVFEGALRNWDGNAGTTFYMMVSGSPTTNRTYSNSGNFNLDNRVFIMFDYHIVLISGSFGSFRLPPIKWTLYTL